MDHAPRKLILLDRDGVINFDSATFIKRPEEWRALPDAPAAIASLQNHFDVAVCTNQSGVGRGLFSEETLAAIHAKMNRQVVAAGGQPLAIFYCPHHPEAGCNCRKPKPGLLHTAMENFAQSPANTTFVGDSDRDLQAATQAGCAAVLVLSGNGQKTLQHNPRAAMIVYDDLPSFAAAALADLPSV